MKDIAVIWIVVMGLIGGGIYLFARPKQQSNAEKYAECTKTVGEIHDSSRKTITTNASGYNKDEQAYYYTQTENGYTRDLNNCRQIYGQ